MTLKNYTFKDYLATHPKRYHDLFSEETAKVVEALYSYEYSKENKELLTLFTIYVQYNLPTCALKDSEVAFLVYEYLSHKLHWQSQQREYEPLKKFLTEEIDEEDLSHWISCFHDLILDTIDDFAKTSSNFLKEVLKNEK